MTPTKCGLLYIYIYMYICNKNKKIKFTKEIKVVKNLFLIIVG